MKLIEHVTAQMRGIGDERHIHGESENANCPSDDSYGLLEG